MNKEKWNGLPDDIKKTFAETSEDWVDKIAMKTLEADFAGLDYLKQCGVQMTTLPDEEIQKMQEAVKPVMQKYMKDMEGKGFKRAEMEAQLQFIRERIAYWSKHEKDRNLKSPWMQ
jgi:TRAP-type C4-dicarboxylate transport system substrate-binding protein